MKYWAVVGGLVGLIIVIRTCWLWEAQSHIENLLWIHVALLMFHQFEEYVYPGRFKDFYNRNIFQKTRVTSFRLEAAGVLWVNIFVGWTAYLIAALVNIDALVFVAGLLLITIGNGVLHTFLSIKMRKYNPGLISGLILFIPFGIFMLDLIASRMTTSVWMGAITIFLFGSAMIPLSIYLTSSMKLIHED